MDSGGKHTPVSHVVKENLFVFLWVWLPEPARVTHPGRWQADGKWVPQNVISLPQHGWAPWCGQLSCKRTRPRKFLPWLKQKLTGSKQNSPWNKKYTKQVMENVDWGQQGAFLDHFYNLWLFPFHLTFSSLLLLSLWPPIHLLSSLSLRTWTKEDCLALGHWRTGSLHIRLLTHNHVRSSWYCLNVWAVPKF